jgi:hypothetical protein
MRHLPGMEMPSAIRPSTIFFNTPLSQEHYSAGQKVNTFECSAISKIFGAPAN